MLPIAYASYLTYATTPDPPHLSSAWTKKYFASTSTPGALTAGGVWERIHELEHDSRNDTSPHMRVIVDHTKKRAIMAFRGACLDPHKPDCNNDMCVLQQALLTTCVDGEALLKKHGDYVKMAAADVKAVHKHLGDSYALIVSGHSLGGMLAMTVDSIKGMEEFNYQVVALEPTPWGNVARHLEGVSKSELATWDVDRRYATYEPHDLASTSFEPMTTLRPSATVCVYEHAPLPKACKDCVKATKTEAFDLISEHRALDSCYHGPIDPKLHYSKCKDAVHFINVYVTTLFELKTRDGKTEVPKCQVVRPK
jgi:hypothetical protein